MGVKGLKGFQMVVTGNYNTQHPFGLLGPFSKKMQILLAIANYSLLSTNKKGISTAEMPQLSLYTINSICALDA